MRQITNGRIEVTDNESGTIYVMEERLKESTCFVTVRGELRNEFAYEFEDEITALLLTCQSVELDLSEVTYLASKAMQVLLFVKHMTEKNEDTQIRITGCSAAVRTAFSEAGCYSILMEQSE